MIFHIHSGDAPYTKSMYDITNLMFDWSTALTSNSTPQHRAAQSNFNTRHLQSMETELNVKVMRISRC